MIRDRQWVCTELAPVSFHTVATSRLSAMMLNHGFGVCGTPGRRWSRWLW
jgi:hypothetical protein